MYKLFKVSAFEKMENTPIVPAIQHDSARIIPIWIYDLDFKDIDPNSVKIVVRKPSGRRVIENCTLAYNYKLLKTPYSSGNKEYKETYEYFEIIEDEYVSVDFEDLVEGTTYYIKANTVVLAPLVPNALAECGTSIIQIQLNYNSSSGGGKVTTFKMFLKVEKTYSEGAISSNANISQLLDILQQQISITPEEEFQKYIY